MVHARVIESHKFASCMNNQKQLPAPFSSVRGFPAIGFPSGFGHQEIPFAGQPLGSKVGHLQPFYLSLSRLGRSLDKLQVVRPDKFCQA